MSNRRILEAARAARDVGLQIKTLNMVGLPGETPEMHMETVRLNRMIRPTIIGISVFTPLPGTDLYDSSLKEGYLPRRESVPSDAAYRKSVLRMPQFPAKQIERSYKLFGTRVFWRESKLKALGYPILYSEVGKLLLRKFSRWKKYARALLKGF